jgi:putative ABC transport system permease protein
MPQEITTLQVVVALLWGLLYTAVGLGLLLIGALFAYMVGWERGRRSLVLALRSLRLHKLRSFLSVSGIIIGTAAVIILLAFGKGSMEDTLNFIRQQGTTNVIIRSVKPTEDTSSGGRRSWIAKYGLTWDDYERCITYDTVVGQVPMRAFLQDVRRGERATRARVVATTTAYGRINRFDMAVGRFLVGDDDATFQNVVVLGAKVAEDLFPFEHAVGQSIYLNKHQYRVVGVIKPRRLQGTTTASGQTAEDPDNDLYLPIRTCQVRFGAKVFIPQGSSRIAEEVQLHQITLTVSDVSTVRSTGDAVRDLVGRYHTKKDWEVVVPLDRLEEAERARDSYNWLLFWIASISLFVGGIGIMNIMLATVTERTREIGIRRALGAKRRDITMQFIIEAVVQTTLGGVLGVLVGLTVVFGIPLLTRVLLDKPLPVQLELWSIFLSLGVAVTVGVLFGWYPAHRASRLDPIEALRHV